MTKDERAIINKFLEEHDLSFKDTSVKNIEDIEEREAKDELFRARSHQVHAIEEKYRGKISPVCKITNARTVSERVCYGLICPHISYADYPDDEWEMTLRVMRAILDGLAREFPA